MRAVSTRRHLLVAAAGALALSACVDPGGRGRARAPAEPPAATVAAPSGNTLGTGATKVALILPLTAAGQGAVAAASLRNAAELAMASPDNADLTILVKDDRGTADGAREAATAAVADGAEMILGPLFAPSVAAAGSVAKGAGKPVVAFSTDSSVAQRGVYLLSFMAQGEVERVVEYAANQGRSSFAALIPDTTYGNVVEAAFRETAARRGVRVVTIERYPAGQPQAAVERLAPVVSGAAAQADALFLPDSGEGLAAAAGALTGAGFSAARVKILGTGLWNAPASLKLPALAGGWFAAPDQTGYAGFATRYRAKYGTDPTRLATLAYDAVSLASVLARAPGRFSDGAITNPQGFAGADGTFRFRPDGTSERALAVQEVRGGAAATVSPAPKAFSGT